MGGGNGGQVILNYCKPLKKWLKLSIYKPTKQPKSKIPL